MSYIQCQIVILCFLIHTLALATVVRFALHSDCFDFGDLKFDLDFAMYVHSYVCIFTTY